MEEQCKILWKFFETTGSVEDYINYIEFRRLTDSEYAKEMDNTQRNWYGRESDGTGNQGD